MFHIHLHVVPRHTGDKLSFAKGMLLRRDPDREESGRLLREALAQLDAAQARLNDMSMPAWEKYIGVPMLMLHDKIYKGTNGRIGHRIFPGTPPNLLLHTVGAKTGHPAHQLADLRQRRRHATSSSRRRVAIPRRRAGITTSRPTRRSRSTSAQSDSR